MTATATFCALLALCCIATPSYGTLWAHPPLGEVRLPEDPVALPPEWPVDGHVHRNRDGSRMRFDARLGVYVVISDHGLYFFDDSFLRLHEGRWQWSPRPQGPWLERPSEWVPIRLRVKHYSEEL